VRSVRLHNTLEALVEAAATALRAEVAAGAEVPFELHERGGRRASAGPALYCYRPLIGEFIATHGAALERLPGYAKALTALADFDGLERYLASAGVEHRGEEPRDRARAAVSVLLEDAFTEQGDFELRPERLRAALERLEQASAATYSEAMLLATLHGLTIASEELAVTSGLKIAHPDALAGLPDGARASGEDGAEHLIVALVCEEEDADTAIAGGVLVLGDLLRSLRLFGDGRVTLGRLAWARVGGGAWRALALDVGGHPHGMLVVTPEQEDELRAFCNLVSRRAPEGNALAWALRRFELGCERDSPYEALSDHLLALRALLEPEGPASGMLSGRLAALCATPTARERLTKRTVKAIELERSYVAGRAADRAGARALVQELSDHLRALLRDVVCGHLAPDLVALADEILLTPDSAEQVPGDVAEREEILDLLV
jgi:hypothetical protein